MERLMSDKAALSDVRSRLCQRCGFEADYQPQELGDRLGDFLLAASISLTLAPGEAEPSPARSWERPSLAPAPGVYFDITS
jgi:hypothetical protein